MQTILEVRNITKTFPGVIALDDVNMEFQAGEIHALVGENGAGKSTLIKTLTGVNIPDGGEIWFDGKRYKSFTPKSAKALGIGVIYQELNLVNQLSAAENIFLSALPRKGILLNRREMVDRTRGVFKELGIELSPNVLVKDLTIGFQQMVELAKAIVEDSRVLIMDEPTAPLSNREVEILFGQIKKLKEKGITIIYISHRLEEIFRIADRVSILRDGKTVETKPVGQTDKDQLIRMMVGRELKEVYPKVPPSGNGEVLLESRALTGNGVRNVSLCVKKGEIFGLGGLVGAGRTEFAQMLFGAAKIDAGEILFKGKPMAPKNPNHAMRQGITLVPEDRKQQGLLLGQSVKNNISLAVLKKLSRWIVLNKKKELRLALDYKENLQIKLSSMQQLAKNLSGGNQQKVVLAKGLATEPELIIIDEPTRGIDVGAKQEIYHLMNNLIEKGKTIIMITSEMEELLGMSDRIAVFAEGSLAGILEKDQFNAETVLRYASHAANQEEKKDEQAV